MSLDKFQFLKEKAQEARICTLTAINAYGCGHVGGAMSIIELLTVLYYEVMRIDPNNPAWEDRDRLVVSKGHAAPAVYSLLAMRGYFEKELLKTLNANGTSLPSHCDMQKVPGIDMTTGSLGQGISAAVGMAIAAKMDKKDINIYAIVGDGECQEGEVWEAALLAPQRKLDNLTVFIDNNKLQVDGFVDNIVKVRPNSSKWEAFGWDVQVVKDGHNMADILNAINQSKTVKEKPHLIVLDTVKAKGVEGYEGKENCHFFNVDDDLYKKVIDNL
ncbi:MAG: transketolase [Acetivibrionales bacterium]|jgi:transketolase